MVTTRGNTPATLTRDSAASKWAARTLLTAAILLLFCAAGTDTASVALDLPATSTVHAAERAATAATSPFATLPALPSRIAPVAAIPVRLARKHGAPLTGMVRGMASWYGKVLQDHLTASGKRFNAYDLTAAHRTLPFGSRVRVTDLRNHRSVIVTITDRGVLAADRVIDLSYAAADQLGMVRAGVDPVRLELLPAEQVLAGAAGLMPERKEAE